MNNNEPITVQDCGGTPLLRQVLDCGSPLPLLYPRLQKRQRTGALQDAIAPSKTFIHLKP